MRHGKVIFRNLTWLRSVSTSSLSDTGGREGDNRGWVYFKASSESPLCSGARLSGSLSSQRWWTFSRMEREMECAIVESPVHYPMRPNNKHPLHPPIHTQGSGSTSDLGQSGLALWGTGQWCCCFDWHHWEVLESESVVTCKDQHWLFISTLIKEQNNYVFVLQWNCLPLLKT